MFHHLTAAYSGLVIEVSYPPKTKALGYLADDYILQTEGAFGLLLA
jgi:hypothetical protein